MVYSRIASTGSYLPQQIMTNDDLAKLVDTSDEWITTRTGIKQRHIANAEETTSYMAAQAGEKAIKKAGISKNDIDLIIVATTTPDKTFPSTAAIAQATLKIERAAAFDIQAVCSGFIYALAVADSMIKSGNFKNALVIGSEKMSALVDWKDRSTCVLFGDGAGAVVLTSAKEFDRGVILSQEIAADGTLANILCTSGGVSTTKDVGCIMMEGREVFRKAVECMSSSITNLITKHKLTYDDISWIIPHQANVRIINYIAQKLDIDESKFIVTVDKHANTSAASIPLALDHASSKFKKGSLIVMTAAGGGFTWGSLLLRW